MDNKKEKSCGAIIYKWEMGKLFILVLHMQKGHFSFCKGHVEKDETEKETALREIKEETNLDVYIDTNFRRTITYSPQEGVDKDVVFFVAEAKPGVIIPQEVEVYDIFWCDEQNIYNIIKRDNERTVLESAIEYIKKHRAKR